MVKWLIKWLNVRLRTKWLWVRVPMQSLNLQIWRLLRARSLDIQTTIECGFTLKRVRDMIKTYKQRDISISASHMVLCKHEVRREFNDQKQPPEVFL